MKFRKIEDLYTAIKTGQIEEGELTVVLDNDCTCFYYGTCEDDDGNEIDNEIEVEEASGYNDIETLYRLLFPDATVEWC